MHHDAPPDALVGWGGGHPLPILLPLDAFGVSTSAPTTSAPSAPRFWPPPIQIPGYAHCNRGAMRNCIGGK